MTARPSQALIDWVESFERVRILEDGWMVVGVTDSYELRPTGDGDDWEVGFRERGRLAHRMHGRQEFAERFFVWFTAEAALQRRGRGSNKPPVAPWQFPAIEGPLRIGAVTDRRVEVVARDEVVAVFPRWGSGSKGYEFTHYGFLPLEVLIEQLRGPSDDLIFPTGHRARSDEEHLADARRIREGAARLLAGMKRPDVEGKAPGRIVGLEEVRRRLRIFSFMYPLPKDGGGWTLQIAFRVVDEAAGRGLLAMMRLGGRTAPGGVQHPDDGPFTGAAVIAELSSASMTPTADFVHEWLVRVTLWNDTGPHADAYQITAALVDRAEEIEARLTALGLDRHPRQIGLLGFSG